MRAQETVSRATPADAQGDDGSVNLWADSVGDAVGQLEIIVPLAIAVQLASGLLTDVAKVLH